jgi:hypothetical protein
MTIAEALFDPIESAVMLDGWSPMHVPVAAANEEWAGDRAAGSFKNPASLELIG